MKKIVLKKGFTLVEMLACVVILLLLSAVAARGVSAAVESYSKIVNSANAQLLLSTTLIEIRDEVCLSTDLKIEKDDDHNDFISYTSSVTGDVNIIKNSADGIKIVEYYTSDNADERLLVSNLAANKNLVCTYDDATLEDGILTISNIVVTKKNSRNVLAKLSEYMVRVG